MIRTRPTATGCFYSSYITPSYRLLFVAAFSSPRHACTVRIHQMGKSVAMSDGGWYSLSEQPEVRKNVFPVSEAGR